MSCGQKIWPRIDELALDDVQQQQRIAVDADERPGEHDRRAAASSTTCARGRIARAACADKPIGDGLPCPPSRGDRGNPASPRLRAWIVRQASSSHRVVIQANAVIAQSPAMSRLGRSSGAGWSELSFKLARPGRHRRLIFRRLRILADSCRAGCRYNWRPPRSRSASARLPGDHPLAGTPFR